jgi:hypothetical protein
MNIEADIPIPIRFNPLKHHRNFMLDILANASPEEIISSLDAVCNNYNDVYTGEMSPEAIGKEIIRILKEEKVFSKEDLARWLNAHNGYRKLQLPDSSEWIVRLGNEDERYVHLHPSRDGKHTVRFKGSSLKTVFLIKALLKDSAEPISLENVNHARKLIGLSPIKRLDWNKGILVCYKKFFRLLF